MIVDRKHAKKIYIYETASRERLAVFTDGSKRPKQTELIAKFGEGALTWTLRGENEY